MGGIYRVNGLAAASIASTNEPLAGIWNPSSTRTIVLVESACFITTANSSPRRQQLRRTTARGTAGSTVTPTAQHDIKRKAAPDSGFLVDFSQYSAVPTYATGNLYPSWSSFGSAGSSWYNALPRGIEIPPGTGLCFTMIAGAEAWPISEWFFEVEEL